MKILWGLLRVAAAPGSFGLPLKGGSQGLAAAVVVVAAAAQIVAVAVAAAAQQEDQDDDPPAVVPTKEAVTVTHMRYLQIKFVTAFAVHSMLFPHRQKVRQNSAAAPFSGKVNAKQIHCVSVRGHTGEDA